MQAAGGQQALLDSAFMNSREKPSFYSPPNETESKSKLIGNRQDGEDLAREELGPTLGWELYVRGCVY